MSVLVEENIPLPFKILLAGLTMKLTKDRLAGEKQI